VVAGIQPAPLFTSQVSPTLVLFLFGSLTAVAFLYGLRLAFRTRDIMPVVSCLGALVGALNEPIYDLLGKIVYASDHPIAFSAFDRHIPWFLVLGYLPWVGLLPVLVARAMAAGMSRTRLHVISFSSFLSVVAVESLGTSLDSWGYYGVAPLKYLGVAPQMAAVPIVGGLLLYVFGEQLHGWQRASLGVVPTMVLPLVYAAVSWPGYIALNSDGLPAAVNWLAAAAMLGFTVMIVLAATWWASRWRALTTATLNSAEGAELGQLVRESAR
jgi:hypothetical protein